MGGDRNRLRGGAGSSCADRTPKLSSGMRVMRSARRGCFSWRPPSLGVERIEKRAVRLVQPLARLVPKPKRAHRFDRVAFVPEQVAAQPHAQLGRLRHEMESCCAP